MHWWVGHGGVGLVIEGWGGVGHGGVGWDMEVVGHGGGGS